MLSQIFSQYCYFLHTIPFFVYTFYLIFRDVDHPIIDALAKIGLLAMGMVTAYTIMGCILRIPFKTLIPFTWHYQGPITWGLLFITYYCILIKKEVNNLTSFTLATLATVGGGWLYEVPFFHPISMFLGRGSFFYNNIQILCVLLLLFELRKEVFDPNPVIYAVLISCMFLGWRAFPFPNGQIICLLLLGYELMKMSFKPNTFIIIMLVAVMVFSISLFLDNNIVWHFYRNFLKLLKISWTYTHANAIRWTYRIPASLFLLSLLTGIKERMR